MLQKELEEITKLYLEASEESRQIALQILKQQVPLSAVQDLPACKNQ